MSCDSIEKKRRKITRRIAKSRFNFFPPLPNGEQYELISTILTTIRINERNFCAFRREIIRVIRSRDNEARPVLLRGGAAEGRGGCATFSHLSQSCQVDTREA